MDEVQSYHPALRPAVRGDVGAETTCGLHASPSEGPILMSFRHAALPASTRTLRASLPAGVPAPHLDILARRRASLLHPSYPFPWPRQVGYVRDALVRIGLSFPPLPSGASG